MMKRFCTGKECFCSYWVQIRGRPSASWRRGGETKYWNMFKHLILSEVFLILYVSLTLEVMTKQHNTTIRAYQLKSLRVVWWCVMCVIFIYIFSANWMVFPSPACGQMTLFLSTKPKYWISSLAMEHLSGQMVRPVSDFLFNSVCRWYRCSSEELLNSTKS